MSKYSEPEVFKTFDRLVNVYLESYPDDRAALERFMRWAYTQYGYRYGRT